MNRDIEELLTPETVQYDPINSRVMLMGSALIILNIVLMLFVGMYWINPQFHLYLSGSPL